ncbi:hypothetical protein HMPREF1548_03356, partial [Clostridium sp. KLE 1755]
MVSFLSSTVSSVLSGVFYNYNEKLCDCRGGWGEFFFLRGRYRKTGRRGGGGE